MCFVKRSIILVIVIFIFTTAHADEYNTSRSLTTLQVQQVMQVKKLLEGVDKESLQKTIHELEKTRHPQTSLELREAMAKAYVDIVKEVNVEGQKKKEWLYSMICLNMAYLQFGGSQGNPGSTTELNRLIRQKLKEYLPANIQRQPGFLYTL